MPLADDLKICKSGHKLKLPPEEPGCLIFIFGYSSPNRGRENLFTSWCSEINKLKIHPSGVNTLVDLRRGNVMSTTGNEQSFLRPSNRCLLNSWSQTQSPLSKPQLAHWTIVFNHNPHFCVSENLTASPWWLICSPNG